MHRKDNGTAYIELMNQFSCHNYSPLEVVVEKGEGAWVWDVEGNKYLDMLSAYSALNFGHRNPRITKRAIEQLETLTLTGRAVHTKELALLAQELTQLCKMDLCLFMNSGAEAVETAIKATRRWGYLKKGITPDTAEILCFQGNFHGRTTTIISFSDSPEGRKNFGPYTPGFRLLPFGDLDAVRQAITPSTAGVLVEPIQGEGGVILPPSGFLSGLRELCDKNHILLVDDEIQTGLGRTGALFAADHEGVTPDLYIIGKSLGGGILPISAVVGKRSVLEVFTPNSHGSTFGGNPFAAAIAREVLALIREDEPHRRAMALGEYALDRLRKVSSPLVKEVRGRGLMIGIEFLPSAGPAKKYSKKLFELGVLCKDTREQTLRFAPPLIISKEDLDWGLERIEQVLG